MKFNPSPATDLSDPADFDIVAQHQAAKMGDETEAVREAREKTLPPGSITLALLRAIGRRLRERAPTPGKFILGSAALLATTVAAWGALTFLSHMLGAENGISTALAFALATTVFAFICIWKAPKNGPGHLYSGFHTAILAGAALSAFEVVDIALLATITGPALAGYGVGSFVAVILRAAKTA
jgi:hypothetical protein